MAIKKINFYGCLWFLVFVLFNFNILYSAKDREDNQFWTGFELEYEVFNNFSIELDQELRQENNSSEFKSYYLDIGAKYKFNDFFKIGVFYRYKHHLDYRQNAILINLYQTLDFNWCKLSNRIRLYAKYAIEPEDMEDEFYLRDLLTFSLNLGNFSPYIAAEVHYRTLYDKGDRVDKIRYYIGNEFEINKRNKIETFIMYQAEENVKKPDYDLVFGLFYKLSLN